MRLFLVGLIAAGAACGGKSNGDDGDGGDGPGNATTVMVTLTNRPNDATMFTFVVAYQDGDGAWTVAPAPSGDTYAFPVTASTYGFAWTCIANLPAFAGGEQLRQVVIARFAVSERTSLTFAVPPRCSDRDTTVVLSGNVSNTSGGGNFLVAFGERIGIVNPNTGNYQLMTPPGTHDLLALRIQTGVTAGERVIDRAAIQRGVAVTGPTTANVDFSTSAATQAFPVTISATGRIGVSTMLDSAGGTNVDLVQLGTAPYESRALATAQVMAGDRYEQAISVAANGQTAITTSTTSTPAAQTWSAPAPLGGAIATVPATAPYPQVMATWPTYANAVGYSWQATQPLTMAQCMTTTPCAVSWSALLSPGAVGATPGFQMPDLSALAGWSPNLQPIPGAMINGFAGALTSSAGASDFPPASPAADGTQRSVVRSDFTVTP